MKLFGVFIKLVAIGGFLAAVFVVSVFFYTILKGILV